MLFYEVKNLCCQSVVLSAGKGSVSTENWTISEQRNVQIYEIYTTMQYFSESQKSVVQGWFFLI